MPLPGLIFLIGSELFTYPYPLKVQARPPRDQRQERVAHVVAATGFLSRYLSGPLPYVRRHIRFTDVYTVSSDAI